MTTVPFGTPSSAQGLIDDMAARHGLPLAALVHLTRRCNLRCAHCFQVDREVPELTTAEWSVVLRRLAEAGVLFATLTGGEPALRDDFLEIVGIARSLDFAVKVKTNGLRLDPAACKVLAAAPVTEVHISLYSVDPPAHDAVTGLPGSQVRSLWAARALRAAGVRVVLACPLMEETFDGYERLMALAAAEGMDYVFDPGIAVREDGCEDPARLRLTEAQVERLVSDPRVSGGPQGGVARPRRLEDPVCRIGRTLVAVAPNGDVWPCARIPEPLGNLLRDPLERIWAGNPALARYAGIRWGDLPACRTCDALGYCVRCHADALYEDRDLLGPATQACRMARVRAAVDSRRRLAAGKGSDIVPRGLVGSDLGRRILPTSRTEAQEG